MINLLTAIQTQLASVDGTGLRALIASRMTIGEAPEGTARPLVELVAGVGGETNPTLDPDATKVARLETTNVDFIIHDVAASPLAAENVAAALKVLYDGAFMSLGATQNMVDVQRVNPGNLVRDYNDDSWNLIVTYTYTYG